MANNFKREFDTWMGGGTSKSSSSNISVKNNFNNEFNKFVTTTNYYPPKKTTPKKTIVTPKISPVDQFTSNVQKTAGNVGSFFSKVTQDVKKVNPSDAKKRASVQLSSATKQIPSVLKIAGSVIIESYAQQQRAMEVVSKKLGIAKGLLGFNTFDSPISNAIQKPIIEKIEKEAPKIREQAFKEQQKLAEPVRKLPKATSTTQNILDAIIYNLPLMATSMGLTVGTAFVTKNPVATTTVGLSTGFGLGANEVYTTAREEGLSDQKSVKLAQLGGVVIGALDFAGVFRLTKPFTKPVQDSIKQSIIRNVAKSIASAGVQSGIEGVTEGLQEVVANAIRISYSENKDLKQLVDNVGMSILVGAIMGGGADVVTNVIGNVAKGKTMEQVGKELDVTIENILKTPKEERTEEEQKLVDFMLNKEFTPDEALELVSETNLKDTSEGKEIIKAVLLAKQQNKSIKVVTDEKTGELTISLIDPETPVRKESITTEEQAILDQRYKDNFIQQDTQDPKVLRVGDDWVKLTPEQSFALRDEVKNIPAQIMDEGFTQDNQVHLNRYELWKVKGTEMTLEELASKYYDVEKSLENAKLSVKPQLETKVSEIVSKPPTKVEEPKSVKSEEEGQNLTSFKVGEIVRDIYDNKLYKVGETNRAGVATITDTKTGKVSQMNAGNNPRYVLNKVTPQPSTPNAVPSEKPTKELVMRPSKGTPKEVEKEVVKLGLPSSVLKFSNKGGGNQFAYRKPLIGKTDLKTIVKGSNEFSANPVLTVIKNKEGNLRLAFDGKKIHFQINPDALGLSAEQILKLKIGTKIKVDEKSLTGTKQQMRVYKGTETYASQDKFAELPVLTKKAEERFQSMNIVEMPELVRIVKELMGKYPRVVKNMPGKFGAFRTNMTMRLRADIFADPKQASKTLAHEIGHLEDFLPDHTMSRGNLLGRIGSLNKFMGSFLAEFPGGEIKAITPKERAKLQRDAKKMGKTNYETIEKEIVVGTEPINPEEVLAIWNSVTDKIKNPELLTYIQGLDTQQKKALVIGAMKGDIPEWVAFKKTIKKTITEKVLRNAPADIRKIYEKLLKEEIIKRRLIDLKEIKKELQMLSQVWKPYNPNQVPPSYVAYRNEPAELYADAISVLYNDPVMLQQQAPEFYKSFFNYLERKPEVKETYLAIQETISKGENAVFEERRKAVREGYNTAEDKQKAQLLEKLKTKTNILHALDVLFNDKNAPINRRVRQKIKAGVSIEASENPIFSQAGLSYLDGKIKNFVIDNFQPAYAKANEVPDGWDTLGEIVQMERAIYERGEKANPGGYSPETAQAYLDKLQEQFTPEQWGKLQEAKEMFRDGVQSTVDLMDTNDFKNPELIAQMKANKAYATFQVIDYVEQNLTSAVHESVGTLKDIANPATSTVMKSIVTMKAIEYNNAKKTALNFQKKEFPKEIQPAKSKFNGRTREFIRPKDNEQELVLVIEDGKLQGYYLPKDVAYILNNTTDRNLILAGKISRIITGTPFYRPLFTTMNLGFQTFNFSRDLMRFWRSFPHETLGGVLASPITDTYRVARGYAKAVIPSAKDVLGKQDPLIKEMEDSKMLGLTYNDLIGGLNDEDRQIERALQHSGVLSPKAQRGILRKLATPLFKTLETVELIGNFIERLPKVAGYIELKGSMPQEELAHFIRTRVGSPSFRTQGNLTPITNNVFMFSNAFKEGYKTDFLMATNPKSRSAWWWKTLLTTILPKFLMFATVLGLLGQKAKEEMEGVSEYDKSNYNIITLGTDENGKTIYMRLPQDEWGRLMGALTWKTLRLASPSDQGKIKDMMDVFSLGAGQLPTFSPSIGGMGAVIQYLSGLNPYDSFRNRNVIPDNEFKAGWKYSLPVFLEWLAKQQGAGIIVPTFSPKGEITDLQKFLNLPILSNIAGRWVKVSDYGKTEMNRKILNAEEQKQAEKTIKKNEAVDEAIKTYQSGTKTPERMRSIEAQLIKDVIGRIKNSGDKTSRTALIKKFRMGVLRGKSDPMVNSLIDANTNAEKVSLLTTYKEKMKADEFKAFITDMYRQKVISSNVIVELRRLK